MTSMKIMPARMVSRRDEYDDEDATGVDDLK